MSTQVMRKKYESGNVRSFSRFKRYQRYPVMDVYELPERKSKSIFCKTKYSVILAAAFFLLVTTVNEGVRTWLKYSKGQTESSKGFVMPRPLEVVSQPSFAKAKSADEVGLLREQNRYRVDMTHEQNRFVTDLFGTAERVMSRFNR